MSGLLQSRWAPAPDTSERAKQPTSSSRAPALYPPPPPRSVRNTRNNIPFTSATGSIHTGGSSRIGTPVAPGYANAHAKGNATANAHAAQELSRFTKLVARLKWKLPFLEEGYRRATQQPTTHPGIGIDGGDLMDVTYAETMFKIDFHEYYALLERAIVHLLGVFGVQVTSTPARKWRGKKIGQGVQWNSTGMGPGGGGGGGGGGSGGSRGGAHTYHANVLETLEDPACPLYEVLGRDEVHEQLRKAKELRNRWKTADMSEEEREGERMRRRMLPLESYDFDHILTEIFGGLEEGYLLAQAHVARVDGDAANGREMEMEMDGDWDFIVEAMDWEAI